jgi:hypothetical protein
LKPKRRETSESKSAENQVESKASLAAPEVAPASIPTSTHVSKLVDRSPSPAPGKTRSRYISEGVRREVLLRDQNGCTYRDSKTGRICQSRHGLQFDHLLPFSLGGAHTAQNLTLRCGSHNRFLAKKMGLGLSTH